MTYGGADTWAEQSYFRHDAIQGSARLRDAILRMHRRSAPVVWFDPGATSARLKDTPKARKPARPAVRRTVAKKRGRPPIPFSINPEIERIKDVVAHHFAIDRRWLEWHCNAWSVAHPRMMAMYLARKITGASFPNIGRHFDRDHTTILWACRAVERSEILMAKLSPIIAKLGDKSLRKSQKDAIEQSMKTQVESLAA